MRKYNLSLVIALTLLLGFSGILHAQYWFQTGARASGNSYNNSGASVQIQTITPQNITSGSMAFWVGETLSNGAFLQIGYTISNETGNLETNCTAPNICLTNEFIHAGDAEWFYEYFKPGQNSTFYGNTGPDGSAGKNGTFHTYSFYSTGNEWYFLFDNQTIGSANLNTSNSGVYQPIAMGEVANTSNAKTRMQDVIFANLSAKKYGAFLPVQTAFGTVGYGAGSQTNLNNPYGISELGTRISYFAIGSGQPVSNNNTRLWNLGYRLTIISQYGGISSKNVYLAYSAQTLSAPQVVNISSNTRAVFAGWTGTGLGFYAGPKNVAQLLLTTNITETANWQLQYLVNVSSLYGKVSGSGWYNAGSTLHYNITNTSLSRNGRPIKFSVWSNGDATSSNSTIVNAPMNLTAIWRYQVKLNALNAYKQGINVSYFLINGKEYNSTPLLNANGTSLVNGAYYKGVMLPSNISINQNSQPSINITLPVYNLNLSITGVFGIFPVDAAVTLAFKNGTQVNVSSGFGGRVFVPNVPFGMANATIHYLGMNQTRQLSYGVVGVARFVSLPNMIIFFALVGIAIYLINKREKKEEAAETDTKKKPKDEEA
jgi:hypothetical protein